MAIDKKNLRLIMSAGFLGGDDGGGGTSYSSEAQALFDFVGDVPEVSKVWYNRLIAAYVDSGAWSETGFKLLLNVPSATHAKQVIEVKSLTEIDILKGNGSNWLTPFDTGDARASNKGFELCNSFIDSGFNRSLLSSTNSNAVQIAVYKSTAIYDSPISGFTSPSNRGGIHIYRAVGGEFWVENWGATAYKYTGATGAAGLYSFNRRATNDAEMRINGVVVQSVTSISGSPLNLTDFINTANNAGNPLGLWSRSAIPLYCVLQDGLSLSVMNTLESEITICLDGLGLTEGNTTKLIIYDGNSHPNNWWGKMPRMTELSFCYGAGNELTNFCVSGQTTPQMVALYPTKVSPFVNANTVVFGFEMTNHWATGARGATVYNEYADYGDLVQADSGLFLAIGMMSRGNYSTADAQDVQLINDWVRDNFGTFADGFVELPSWAYFDQGAESDADYATALSALTLDLTYYQADRIHLTEMAYSLLTDLVNTQLTPLL